MQNKLNKLHHTLDFLLLISFTVFSILTKEDAVLPTVTALMTKVGAVVIFNSSTTKAI